MTDPAMVHAMILLAAAAVLLFAAVHDVAVRTVPNLVSLTIAAAGVGLQALDGQLGPALFGGGLVFAGAWYSWRRGWIGGGDVKLLGACTLLVPPAAVPALVLSTAIAGAVLALVYLALGMALAQPVAGAAATRPTGLLGRVWRVERRRIRRRLSLPYACAICAGALLTLYTTVPMG